MPETPRTARHQTEATTIQSRPSSSKPSSRRSKFLLGSPTHALHITQSGANSPREAHPHSSTPQSHHHQLKQHHHNNSTSHNHTDRSANASRLSFSSAPSLDRNHLTASCGLYPRRCSSQSKYHEDCFPKEDPALIIGGAFRRESARLKREAKCKKSRRPVIHNTESLFTNREAVVNIVYSGNLETEQDELSRTRAETGLEARALKRGAADSFARGFLNPAARWSSVSSILRQKRQADGSGGRSGGVAGVAVVLTQGRAFPHKMASWAHEYPPIYVEDSSPMSRLTPSRRSCSPRSEDSSSSPSYQPFRPMSERSVISRSFSPRTESVQFSESGEIPDQNGELRCDNGESHSGSGFLYQMVNFDHIADNVPPFVRQNVKKTGRLLTETFILRLNYLRRRRALGETSSTLNVNAKAKASAASTANPGGSGAGGADATTTSSKMG